jgi:hypothetical protein
MNNQQHSQFVHITFILFLPLVLPTIIRLFL